MKTFKCGWCKQQGIEKAPNGDLEDHKIPGTNAACRRYESWKDDRR